MKSGPKTLREACLFSVEREAESGAAAVSSIFHITLGETEKKMGAAWTNSLKKIKMLIAVHMSS